nr:zinc finger, CCHC-type [Tanacetum cinerariifolium]
MTTSSANNSVFRGFFEKQKLTGPNFIDWYRQLRIVLSIEDKLNYLNQPIPPALVAPEGQQVATEIIAAHTAWIKGSKEIVGLMLMTMEPEIQRNLENLHAHEMLLELKTLFVQQGYIENLECLGHPMTLGLAASLILIGLRKEYDHFVQNYNMHNMRKIVNELHAMPKLHEQTLPKNNACDPFKIMSRQGASYFVTFTEEFSLELPPNDKTVGSKWLFKKKTDMDGAIHTYKARLVAKGYTQTPGIHYEEIISLVVDIRAIRILIAIPAYYDYEIWQMDVKIAFLNGYLSEEVYMEQPEGDIKRELGVSCYIDAGYLTDADDIKSQTRYVFVLNGGDFDWKSAKQSIFATSSAEAKYIVAFDASKEALWG